MVCQHCQRKNPQQTGGLRRQPLFLENPVDEHAVAGLRHVDAAGSTDFGGIRPAGVPHKLGHHRQRIQEFHTPVHPQRAPKRSIPAGGPCRPRTAGASNPRRSQQGRDPNSPPAIDRILPQSAHQARRPDGRQPTKAGDRCGTKKTTATP